MRIDAHQHFWRYSASEYPWIDDAMSVLRRDFLPSELRSEMDAAAIDACIAVQARQTLEETRWLLDLADAHSFIAGVIGWVDLQSADAAGDLEQFATRTKLIGVRHIVQGEPDDRFMLRPAFCRGISLLEDRGLTYDLLIYPKHLGAAIDLVSRFPRQRFVLDHLAKPHIRAGEMREWELGMREIAKSPRVVCKLSGLVTEADWTSWTAADMKPYLDVALECFGPYRLLAGSDWPVCTVAATYSRAIGLIDDYVRDMSPVEREAVMGGNAARLWRLPEAGYSSGSALAKGELV